MVSVDDSDAGEVAKCKIVAKPVSSQRSGPYAEYELSISDYIDLANDNVEHIQTLIQDQDL